MKELVASFEKGSLRALAKLISAAENGDPQILGSLAGLYPKCGNAKIIGLTGVPGSGKSTLVGKFIEYLRLKQFTVAVIAVDPVSPFTGGALLGDRIRLAEHFDDDKVFIRSLSTRGKLGGLSLATRESVHLADAFGFDFVLIETVGVGQSEVAIHKVADKSLVVLGPEAGDGIQTIKAGVLEIADLLTVHKGDRPGAEKMLSELRTMLEISNRPNRPLFQTTIKDPKSLNDLFDSLSQDPDSATLQERRKASVKLTIRELIQAWAEKQVELWVENQVSEDKNPYAFVEKFLAKHTKGLNLDG